MVLSATFRFYEELNDFLSPDRQKQTFQHTFAKGASVKDIVESLGVPHTEVDLILVNSTSVDFSYQVQQDDYVSVYPMFEAFDIRSVIRLRPEPLRVSRFMTDVHLGKLTKYLRLLGFDTLLANYDTDAEIIQHAKLEKRIILTRDLQLLKHKAVTHGYFLRATDPGLQMVETLMRFDLTSQAQPFTRCLMCNGLIQEVSDVQAIADQVPPKVLQTQKNFYQCNQCLRLYWRGTHYEKLQARVQQWLG